MEINEEEFINDYNKRLRSYNEKLNKIFIDLEKVGIVILSDLKIELESEVLSELEMNEVEMKENIINYLRDVIVEVIEIGYVRGNE